MNVVLFFSQALSQEHINEVVIVGDTQYRIVAGSVFQNETMIEGVRSLEALRVAYAKTLAKRKPLVALAGTDPQSLLDATTFLEETQNKLTDLHEGRFAKLLRGALYPTRFLRAASELEARRLAFVTTGSDADLRAYEDATRAAIYAYKRDLRAFRSAFLEVVPEDAPAYVAGSQRITRQALVSAINSLEDGINETELLFRARSACLRGSPSQCQTLNIQSSSPPSPAEISSDKYARAADVKSLYDASRNDDPPLVTMAKGVCTTELPGGGFFALYREKNSLLPTYLGDLRLVDSRNQASVPFYDYFARENINLVASSPLTTYSCPLFAEEFSRLLLVRAFAESAETSLVENEALSSIESGSNDGDEKRESYMLERTNKSTDFDEIVRYVANLEQFIMTAAEHGAPGGLEASTLFYARSAFLALFLAHNPSVVGTPTAFFEDISTESLDQPFIFYGSLKKTTAEHIKILEGLKALDTVHGFTSP